MLKIKTYIGTLLFIALLQTPICFGQTQSAKSEFRLLTYGLVNIVKQNAENVIAQKWGIEFYAVAGCVVTQELADSVEQHNKTVETLIAKKYGEDWKDKFYKEVDAEYKIEKKITTLIGKLEYIKMKQFELEKKGNSLQYIMTPVPGTTQYDVSVQGWGKLDGEYGWIRCYKLLVDYKTKSAKLVSDKIVKE